MISDGYTQETETQQIIYMTQVIMWRFLAKNETQQTKLHTELPCSAMIWQLYCLETWFSAVLQFDKLWWT